MNKILVAIFGLSVSFVVLADETCNAKIDNVIRDSYRNAYICRDAAKRTADMYDDAIKSGKDWQEAFKPRDEGTYNNAFNGYKQGMTVTNYEDLYYENCTNATLKMLSIYKK